MGPISQHSGLQAVIECLVWGPCVGNFSCEKSISFSFGIGFSSTHEERRPQPICEGLTMKLVLLGAAQHGNKYSHHGIFCLYWGSPPLEQIARQVTRAYLRSHTSAATHGSHNNIVASNGWSSMSAGFAAKGGGGTVRSTLTNMVHGGHRNATARFGVLLI